MIVDNLVIATYRLAPGIARIIVNHIKNDFLIHYLKKQVAITWRPSPESHQGFWWYSMIEGDSGISVTGCIASDTPTLTYDDSKRIVLSVIIKEEASHNGTILNVLALGACSREWLVSFIEEVGRDYSDILKQTQVPISGLMKRLEKSYKAAAPYLSKTDFVFKGYDPIDQAFLDNFIKGPVHRVLHTTDTKQLPNPTQRRGRYRLLPEEINRRKKIVKQAEQLKRKKPQLLWKEIATNLELPVRTLYEYLRQYGTFHRQRQDK